MGQTVKKTAAILLLAFSCCLNLAYAQSAKNKEAATPKVTTPKKAANLPSTPETLAPFSLEMLSSGRVSKGFTGFPPERIANALLTMTDIVKGEFETTADFETRKASRMSSRYTPNLALSDIHAFTLNVGKKTDFPSGIAYKYDADAESVTIFVGPSEKRPNQIGSPNRAPMTTDLIRRQMDAAPLDIFPLSSKVISQSSYMGSNAYGATVKVEKTVYESVSLGLNMISFVFSSRSPTSTGASPMSQFKLEPTKAAKELVTLKALLIVRLVEPYLEFDFFHGKATRDSPSDVSISDRLIRGKLEEIVIYSGLTGEIFTRIPDTKVE